MSQLQLDHSFFTSEENLLVFAVENCVYGCGGGVGGFSILSLRFGLLMSMFQSRV